MQEFIIQKEEAGQTVMKYLARLLPEASMGLLRKSMRKKNIVLNGKKIEGREKIAAGDSVKVWFSDETIENFAKRKKNRQSVTTLTLKHGSCMKMKTSSSSINRQAFSRRGTLPALRP